MPVVDLSLEQLKTYEGRNPRPIDFETYWDQALHEMQAVDPCVELIPAEFQVPSAECFHLYFTGVNGARIHAKYVRPKTADGQHPAVLQFHGYSGCSGDWSEMLAYTALGCSTAWLDVRGQGGLSEDTGGVVGNTLRGHIIRGLQDHDPHKLFFLLPSCVSGYGATSRHRDELSGGGCGPGWRYRLVARRRTGDCLCGA
ncbi:hypothetical protein PAENIP36_21440 [Paenibacillus sp. P36]